LREGFQLLGPAHLLARAQARPLEQILSLPFGLPLSHPVSLISPNKVVMKMEQPKPPKPEKPDLLRDLWRDQSLLKLHLLDGTVLEGRIKQFDQYNLRVKVEDGTVYLIPKHALVYVEVIP
jgi:sRNA-binding regulator protein Hfq